MTVKKGWASFFYLTLGSLIFSLSLALFLNPASIVTGGVSGIAILLAHYIPLGVGLLFLLVNIPMLSVGVWVFGSRFMVTTLYATLLSSLLTELFALLLAPLLPLTENGILAAFFGGLLCGIGLGLVFRGGGTTGGTDIGVRLLKRKWQHIREGAFFFIIDSLVVAASALVFRSFEASLYSTFALIVCSKAVDTVLYGNMEKRLVLIVSEKPEEIGERLMWELEVGITYLNGLGGYYRKERRIILCAVKARLYPKLWQTVAETDPTAFTIVTTAKEVFGEGFSRYHEHIRQKNKRKKGKGEKSK